MSALVIETSGLRKEFRTRRGRHIVAVHDLDLAVPAGGVHGFLGPNGSGKTTTIRMLLGLARASKGEMRLFGESVPRHLPTVMDRVGAVVEQPKFVPTFTGRKNLSLLARSIGVPGSSVDAALEQVGLSGRDRERFKGYSLGMKQRLAIAATLLKSPDLLILDEPTNGLDPAGMADMRDLLRRVVDRGQTVLLSSHLLGEVQQICDRVGVISQGRLLTESTVADLRGAASVLVRATPVDGAAAVAGRMYGEDLVHVGTDDTLRVAVGRAQSAELTRALVQAGLAVHEIRPVERTLEEVFFEMTNNHETTPVEVA
jgi:ABC-2 type transport system ATP-binding protein